jgi:hypothetical protein
MGKGIVKLGEGQWAVKDGNLLAAKETNGRFKNTEFTVSRGTDATYVDRDGLISNETGNDTPRIDFTDNTDGHLLLEPQSTNLLPYSEDFTTWTVNAATTVYSNTTETLSPSGEYNASKITSDGSNGLYKAVAFGGGNNTKSIYLKGIVGGEQVILRDPAQTITQKTLTLTTDWVRYDLSENQTSTIGLWINEIPSNGIYMWGGQLEALSHSTSYIPTNGLTGTRDAETCTGAGSSADFNSEEGVLYLEIAALENDGTKRRITLNNGTSSLFVQMEYRTITNQIQIVLYNGAAQGLYTETLTDIKQFNKIAYSYKENEFKLFVNGSQIGSTIITGTTFSANTLTELDFDNGNAADKFYGKCKAIRVYKDASIDLATLTS